MNIRAKIPATVLVASLLTLLASSGPTANAAHLPAKGEKTVYVCACLKNKSCSCMTEAKTEGPCACGTQGGPPMKAVPKDSDWARENRDALAH